MLLCSTPATCNASAGTGTDDGNDVERQYGDENAGGSERAVGSIAAGSTINLRRTHASAPTRTVSVSVSARLSQRR